MLAGCSSTLLSPRHRLRSEPSAPLQACHFQVQEKLYPSQQKMSTQRLDLPCSLSRKEAPRVAISLEKAIEQRGNCSFRQNPITPSSSSSSLVAQTVSWEARREIESGFWEKKGKSLKRFYERTSSEEDTGGERVKRKKSSSSGTHSAGGGGGEPWFPFNTIEDPPIAEEERAYFVPSAAIFPPLPASTEALISSFGSKIADTGEHDVGTSEDLKQKTKSDSSSSSDTHSSSPILNENSPVNETGNGSRLPHPSETTGVAAGEYEIAQAERQGLELVSLLMACVESIGSGNYAAANYFLARLGELASPERDPIHRVVAYFTEALALRVAKLWPHIFCTAPPRELADRMEDDDATALRLLNHVSPIPKFIHFALNERLLRAFEGRDRVHIIDFDIKQGLQWPGLFQSLASRPNPPTHVRITGIGESKQALHDTGARLAAFAESLKLPFEFHPVVDGLEDVRLWMLHVKEKECVAVNCILQLHKALYDTNGAALTDLLGLIRSTNPAIVLTAEQEAEHNDPGWETRLGSSLQYYSAIFDSTGSSGLPLDSPARIKVEEMFGREIRNIVSCEGSERVERHEIFGEWRRLMEERGFRCVGIGERETLQSRMLLKMFSCGNYSVEKQGDDDDDAGLTLKWLDQPLYTVSAWAPIDVAGSTSSISQPG